MPVLSFDETPKRFIVPSTASQSEQGWVEMATYPLCADDYFVYYGKLYDQDGKEKSEAERPSLNAEVLARRIKKWNYTDGTGAPLQINSTNIGHLGNADQLFLVNCIESSDESAEADSEEKKEPSSATSSPQPTATQ